MFEIVKTKKFERQFKRLFKKHRSLREDLLTVVEQLEQNPYLGTPLGDDCYKIRLAMASKGQGKSGGARVITYLISENLEVYLLTIYDKSELDSIDDKTLKTIISSIKAGN